MLPWYGYDVFVCAIYHIVTKLSYSIVLQHMAPQPANFPKFLAHDERAAYVGSSYGPCLHALRIGEKRTQKLRALTSKEKITIDMFYSMRACEHTLHDSNISTHSCVGGKILCLKNNTYRQVRQKKTYCLVSNNVLGIDNRGINFPNTFFVCIFPYRTFSLQTKMFVIEHSAAMRLSF